MTRGYGITATRLMSIAGALVFSVACSDAPASNEVAETVGVGATSGSGPLSLASTQPGELEAAMDGVLAIQDGCLGLDPAGSGEFVELVWEVDGVHWTSDPPAVEYRGKRAAPGDPVTVGGRVVPDVDHLQRPEGCDGADRTFKVDSLSR